MVMTTEYASTGAAALMVGISAPVPEVKDGLPLVGMVTMSPVTAVPAPKASVTKVARGRMMVAAEVQVEDQVVPPSTEVCHVETATTPPTMHLIRTCAEGLVVIVTVPVPGPV